MSDLKHEATAECFRSDKALQAYTVIHEYSLKINVF